MRPVRTWIIPAGAFLAASWPGAALAQLDGQTAVTVLRECRKIEDVAARTACYDNIPIGDAAGSSPPDPAPSSFGGEQVPRPPRPRAAAEPDRITATVASAVEREPGIYLVVLEDGSQWQFVDSAPPAYDPPSRGSKVEIAKAALGSYLLRHAGQGALRARRVR